MDFEAIENFWFGEIKTPEFPFEPINLGVTLVDPLESPEVELSEAAA